MTFDLMFVTLGASTVETAGAVIVAALAVVLVTYAAFNILAGRREVGSEIELAPNRRPYIDDEELETTKLNRTLTAGLVLLVIVAVGLPLYWLHEPGRQDGAIEMFDETFINRGEQQYNEGSDCAACHGPEGTGGSAQYTLLDDEDGFIANLAWTAPALDTAWLRFSEEELAYIIEYGRPGTPMVGWGAGGDGPRTEQQIDNIIAYLFDIGISSEEAQAAVEEQLADQLGLLDEDMTPEEIQAAIDSIDYPDPETGDPGDPQVGEELFNMSPALGGGAYACARCHTAGWSLQTDGMEVAPGREGDVGPYVDFPDGSGAFGPPLRDEVGRQFATVDDLAQFIAVGDEVGEGYGRQGQGSGNMPAFGDNPNTEDTGDGMWSREMVCAAAVYVATLDGETGEEAESPEGQVDAEIEEAAEAEVDAQEAAADTEDLPFDAEGYCSDDGNDGDGADDGTDDPEDGESE